MKTLCSLALVSTLTLGLALSALSPTLAFAEPPSKAATEEGRTHFTRGVSLFKEADFRAALIEFKKAYEIAPNYRVQYNIGQSCLELQDYGCALAAFQRYLHDGDKELPAARKKEVEKEVARLASLVAHVRVSANKEGAEISVDDVTVGKSPLPQALVVGAGRHKFSATLAPLPAVTKVVDIASGDEVEVKLELSEPQVTAAAPVAVVPLPTLAERPASAPLSPPPPAPPSRVPFFIGLAGTAVLTGGAVALGVASLGAKSTLDRRAGELGVSPTDVDSARSTVKTLTLVTDIVAATAVVAGVVTTVLYFTTSPSSRTEPKQARRWTPTPFGVAGTF